MNKNGNASIFGLAVVGLLLVSCSSPKIGLMASNDTKEKYHAAEINEYMESLADEDSPGFSYLISKDGRVIAKGSVGFADVENKKSNDTGTIFKAASITKQFTAVSILLLVEQGKLGLYDKLETFFPELPNAKTISIRNLLDHTSGMWEQEKDEDFPFPIETEVPSSVHLSYIQKNKPYFEPGEKWHYCSNGYFVLGLIVEKIAGVSLETYMNNEIFKPLGMRNSGLHGSSTNYANSAIGYGVSEGKPYKEKDSNMTTYNGAAALYSTVEDLFIWNEALHGGKLLSEKSYKEMISPHIFKNGFVPFVGYGLGLGIEDLAGHSTIGHPGRVYGFHSDILRIPDDNINYIFLSNVNINQLKVKGRVAEKVIEILYKP
ncbi:serine hydrolase domain-containing protein [Cellvibrio sp.]|jgi:D-alanyl-D-alanine carboxypeptidase